MFCLVLLTGCPKKNDKLTREVMFTFSDNEILYYDEYAADINVDESQFALIAQDTVTGLQTFILNGKRRLTGRNINVHNLDLNDYNNCTIIYGDPDRDSEYVWDHVWYNGKKYGPYTEGVWISYDYDAKAINDRGVSWLYNRGEKTLIHEIDGSERFMNEMKTFAASPSKAVEVTFDPESMTVTIASYGESQTYALSFDGTDKSLYYPDEELGGDGKPYGNHLRAFDDGSAYFSLEYYDMRRRTCETFATYIHDGQEVPLSGDEYFDYNIQSVISGYLPDYEEGVNFFEYYSETVESDYGDVLKQDWNNNGAIVINGEQVFDGVPFKINYNSNTNHFVWFTLEGNEIVKYRYDLNKEEE